MTIPIPEENWTRYPNYILDNLPSFSGSQLKVISCIVRQNCGFKDNPNYRFAVSYVCARTGLSNISVSRALRELCKSELIIQLNDLGPAGERQYSINWEIKGAKKVTPLKSKPLPPKKVSPFPLKNLGDQKKQDQRNKIKETNSGFSKNEINELTDHLISLRPDLRKQPGDWWAQQIKHVQNMKKNFSSLTTSKYNELITAHYCGKRNGAFWNTPTDLRALTIRMYTHLEDYAEKNMAQMESVSGVSEYRTEFSAEFEVRHDAMEEFHHEDNA